MRIRGIEFETEVRWCGSGEIDSLSIFLEGSDVELSDVLDEKVIREIEEKVYMESQSREYESEPESCE